MKMNLYAPMTISTVEDFDIISWPKCALVAPPNGSTRVFTIHNKIYDQRHEEVTEEGHLLPVPVNGLDGFIVGEYFYIYDYITPYTYRLPYHERHNRLLDLMLPDYYLIVPMQYIHNDYHFRTVSEEGVVFLREPFAPYVQKDEIGIDFQAWIAHPIYPVKQGRVVSVAKGRFAIVENEEGANYVVDFFPIDSNYYLRGENSSALIGKIISYYSSGKLRGNTFIKVEGWNGTIS